MDDLFELGAAAGMTKVARVPKAVKQYRRALQMLSGKGRDPHLFHGSRPDLIKDVVGSGKLKKHDGAHGKGAYLWKDRPLQTYLNRPESVGVAIPKGKMPSGDESSFIAKRHDPARKHMRVWAGKGDLEVPEKSTVIAPSKAMKSMRESIKKRRMRQMDPAVFHRAEADWRAGRHGEAVRPGKKELVKMLRKGKGKTFKKIRSGTEEGVEDFLEGYADQV